MIVHMKQQCRKMRRRWFTFNKNMTRWKIQDISVEVQPHSRFSQWGITPSTDLWGNFEVCKHGRHHLDGEFNPHPCRDQTIFCNTIRIIFAEITAMEFGMQRSACVKGNYLALASSNRLVICNSLLEWAASDSSIHGNCEGGASTVDYLMRIWSLIPEIKEPMISVIPTGMAAGHAYLKFAVKGKLPETVDTINIVRHPKIPIHPN